MMHDMKDRPTEHVAAFDDPALEREWLAQENAMRREQLHLDSRHDDARTQRYRLLARSLRQPLDESLPPDFAQQLAMQLGPVQKRFGTPIESSLAIALCLTLLIGSAIVLAPYATTWWRSAMALSQGAASPFSMLLALAACVGLTGLLGLRPASARKH